VKQARTIRRELTRLIEDRMAELRIDWLGVIDLHGELWPDETLCPLVNPLCPDDLCFLPAGHIGTEEGYHILGTMRYTQADRLVRKGSIMTMAPVGTTRSDLMKLGWDEAERQGWE
jgi:hypothetical protein